MPPWAGRGSLDALAVAVDPLGSLFAWGVGWLMEHVKPLRDALDWLAGKPDEIAAHAATWRNVSAAAVGTHQQYGAAVRMQTADWFGASGDAYRAHAVEQLAAIDGIATVTNAISYAVEGAGLLVGMVREIVRDLIAQFVATLAVRLPQWLAAEGLTLGLATPVVVGQVASVPPQSDFTEVTPPVPGASWTSSGRTNGPGDAYDNVRDEPDADVIASSLRNADRLDGSTGFSVEEIERIRQHIFFEEHPLTDYDTGGIVHRRYDPSPDMAEGWLWLRAGWPLPEDMVLLEHELAEARYYDAHPGATYSEAHHAANAVSNWQDRIPEPTYEDFRRHGGNRGHDGHRPQGGGNRRDCALRVRLRRRLRSSVDN